LDIKVIDAQLLQKMFIAGAKNLEAKKEWINELNVFPVPDGDTGTNMTLTIMSAAKEVGGIMEPDMENISKAISTGSLRGARGNSGVILSQLFRGFTREIKKYDEINVEVLSKACVRAVETAYKAVMKPKEGTILTVAKGIADKTCELLGESEDLEYVIAEVIKHGDYVLSQTPEMLPVLKQAGVLFPARLRLTFNGNIMGVVFYCLLLFWNSKGKNTIFKFRMDVFSLNIISYIKAPAYISGITLSADIFSFLILFIFIKTFCGTYRYITVFKLDLNLIFLKSRKINGHFVSVVFFLYIGLHDMGSMFPIQFFIDVRKSKIIHKIIK